MKLEKALYTLAKQRLKHRYPKAKDRKNGLEEECKRIDFVPMRYTMMIDNIIDNVYSDATQLHKEILLYVELAVNLKNEKMDTYQIDELIESRVEVYFEIMGETLDFSLYKDRLQRPVADSAETPF